MLHISLAGEAIAQIGPFVITNTLLSTWVVMVILFVIAILTSSKLSITPSRFQTFIELAVGGLHSIFESILGKQITKFFPILATFFFFIIISNWFGLLPGVGPSVYVKYDSGSKIEKEMVYNPLNFIALATEETVEGQANEHEVELTPLFRAPTADLNTTLALALISFVLIQVTGLRALGVNYTKKFLNTSGFLPFYVGILETVSELGKIVSFAFRLYGNIFAGEVLIAVISFLIPVIATVPFLGLEIFVGLIQALVFSMLTAVFLSVAVVHEEH